MAQAIVRLRTESGLRPDSLNFFFKALSFLTSNLMAACNNRVGLNTLLDIARAKLFYFL